MFWISFLATAVSFLLQHIEYSHQAGGSEIPLTRLIYPLQGPLHVIIPLVGSSLMGQDCMAVLSAVQTVTAEHPCLLMEICVSATMSALCFPPNLCSPM